MFDTKAPEFAEVASEFSSPVKTIHTDWRPRLRAATYADAAAIADVHTESWRSAYRGIAPDTLLGGPLLAERELYWHGRLADLGTTDIVLVAESCGGEVLGFIAFFVLPADEGGACLNNLHLRPNCRGQGLGPRLLRRSLWSLLTAGVDTGFVWVLDANQPAVRFYEALGARPADTSVRVMAGVDIPQTRYVWDDLHGLAACLRARLGDRTLEVAPIPTRCELLT